MINKDIQKELRKKLKENKKNTFNYLECIKELKKEKYKIQRVK